MKILLINRFSPPDPAPTATLLGELGEALGKRDWEVVHLNGAAGGYRDGSREGSRTLGYLMAHLRILWRGLKTPHPDVILCLSDPPCLIVTSWILSRFHACKLVHWCMDLYPEIAVALQEIPSGLPSQFLQKLNRRCYAEADLLIGLDEDMASRLSVGVGDQKVEVVPPWPPQGIAEPASHPEPKQVFRWLYSGNLGLAHEWRYLLEAQKLLEQANHQIELVFQGRGAAIEDAKKAAVEMGLQHCHFHDYAPHDTFLQSLLEADAHVVTLRSQLKGMLRPSKLSLLLHLPRPLIWVGDSQCAPAKDIQRHHAGGQAFEPENAEDLANYLRLLMESRSENQRGVQPHIVDKAETERLKATSQLHHWLDNFPR